MSVSKAVIISKQFADDFAAVCARYNLTAAEIEEAKQAARRDIANAETCFAALAGEGE